MKTKEGSHKQEGIALPHPLSCNLIGSQSVRATFRLSEKAIEAISVVATQLGIKQKSLFDHLMEDTEVMKLLVQEIRSGNQEVPARIQRTYVLSRRTLACLDRASKSFDTPRDVLVEYSIRRLLPLIEQEKVRHSKRKEVLRDFTEYIKKGMGLLEKSREVLGEEDPLHDRIENALSSLIAAHNHAISLVEKGKIIEGF